MDTGDMRMVQVHGINGKGPERNHCLGGGRLIGGLGLFSAGFSRLARELSVVCVSPSASSLGRLAAPMMETPPPVLWGVGVVVGAPPLPPKTRPGPPPRVGGAGRFGSLFCAAVC
jgi:hypothetical protein